MKRMKKKGFLIDKITEDSFYENLLLGLTSVLKTCLFVTQINLERCAPARLEEVCYWEFNNSLRLPEDMRNFYLSTNGFSFTYTFQYDNFESEEPNCVLAGIEINPLSRLDKLAINDTTFLTEKGTKILAPYSKIYLITKVDAKSCVVLAQFDQSAPPCFWLYYNMKNFYYLCDDFVTYFRMAVAHLGVPGWQLSVLKASLPEWSLEIVQILAPAIFDNRQPLDNKNELNVLDCSIFSRDDDSVNSAPGSVHDEEKVKGVGSVCGKRKLAKTNKYRKQ